LSGGAYRRDAPTGKIERHSLDRQVRIPIERDVAIGCACHDVNLGAEPSIEFPQPLSAASAPRREHLRPDQDLHEEAPASTASYSETSSRTDSRTSKRAARR